MHVALTPRRSPCFCARLPLHFPAPSFRMMLNGCLLPPSSFQDVVAMHSPRWLLLSLLVLPMALPTAGQEKKDPAKRYTEDYYPIQAGYKWHYRVTDLKAPKSPDAPTKKQPVVVITADSEQYVTIKKK